MRRIDYFGGRAAHKEASKKKGLGYSFEMCVLFSISITGKRIKTKDIIIAVENQMVIQFIPLSLIPPSLG